MKRVLIYQGVKLVLLWGIGRTLYKYAYDRGYGEVVRNAD